MLHRVHEVVEARLAAAAEEPQDKWDDMQPHTVGQVFLRTTTWASRLTAVNNVTWGEYRRQAFDVAKVLMSVAAASGSASPSPGVNTNVRAAHVIFSVGHCLDWFFAHAGALISGVVSVSVPATFLPQHFERVLKDSGARLAFVDAEAAANLLPLSAQFPDLQVVLLTGAERVVHKNACTFAEFLKRGKGVSDEDVVQRAKSLLPESPCEVVYCVAGQHAQFHGVVLTHRNITFSAGAAAKYVGANRHDSMISFHPLWNIGEQMWSHHVSMRIGCALALAPESCLAPGSSTFIEFMRAQRPSLFLTIPRIWDRLQQRAQYLSEQKLATRAEILNDLGLDRARYCCCGAAPLSRAVHAWFVKAGIMVDEMLGVPETCFVGLGTLKSQWGGWHKRCVGVPISPAIEAAILKPDGEVVVQGPNIFHGYLNDPQLTASVLDSQGFFYTGLLGTWMGATIGGKDLKLLRITGRKRPVYISAGGDLLYAATVEQQLCKASGIKYALVVGDGLKFFSALIVIDEQEMAKIDEKQEVYLRKQVEAVNESLPRPNRIKRFAVIDGVPSVRMPAPEDLTMDVRKELFCELSDAIAALYGIEKSEIILAEDVPDEEIPESKSAPPPSAKSEPLP